MSATEAGTELVLEGSHYSGDTPKALLRGPVILGYLVVLIFFGGLGAWAALAHIAEAAIAPGVICPCSHR